MEHRLEKNNHQIWLKINTHIYKKKTTRKHLFLLSSCGALFAKGKDWKLPNQYEPKYCVRDHRQKD